jgi:riboflavin synthase
MFTGIIEHQATVVKLQRGPGKGSLQLELPHGLKLDRGSSLAVNGVCLTVTDVSHNIYRFDLLQQTLARTNLGRLKLGERVNIEPPLLPTSPMGGHFVQGHIDTVGTITQKVSKAGEVIMSVQISGHHLPFIVEKGSIAIDGVSLTIIKIAGTRVSVALIPHTLRHTTLGWKKEGDIVNLEFDILGKYVYKALKGMPRITREFLEQQGFI